MTAIWDSYFAIASKYFETDTFCNHLILVMNSCCPAVKAVVEWRSRVLFEKQLVFIMVLFKNKPDSSAQCDEPVLGLEGHSVDSSRNQILSQYPLLPS